MKTGQNFARKTFLWSGVYDIAVLFPLYFMEDYLGANFPPASNHPEQYYGFLGVALAWQSAFILISKDVQRYRQMMLPAIAEKMLSAGAIVVLFVAHRVTVAELAPAVIDLMLAGLFLLAYRSTGSDIGVGTGK